MWQIRIEDPSGETRYFHLNGSATIGKEESSTILLRDPTAANQAAFLEPLDAHSYWVSIPNSAPPALLGDLSIRSAKIYEGLTLQIGESKISLIHHKNQTQSTLPPFPNNVRPWFTSSSEGQKVLWMCKKAAATPLSIYLEGETGTGKEVLAHLIHAWSDRASGPFIPLHCGALALSLAESELFGHVKGAFTGASHHRCGALMQAHQGTLFLDEIGDLSVDLQVKLLRFLENGEIRPVGADRASHANVRLLCATHKPLLELVESGKFRRDLYYRLASITIQIPALKHRPEDIASLSKTFAREMKKTIAPQALLRLQAYDWPGNVRELRHTIERACGLSGVFSQQLIEADFEFLITPRNILRCPELEIGSPILSLEEMERLMLLRALKLAQGHRGKAAKILGIARSTLFEKIKRHKIIGPKTDLFQEQRLAS